ncbi:hypothetical protein EXS45_01975, partial [Candidatus Nomurabacteria bacterium]|nr:hypothetical protein [Candidatus Nomurabacteria bacterium]
MKKFLPYIVILIILVGIFSPLIKVEAQISPNVSIPGQTTAATQKLTVQDNDGSAFKEQIDGGCGLNPFTWSFDGCILKFVYYTYFQIPTFILWLSALIFNVLIRIGLDSTMTSSSGFISAAWAVVRDLSNIFFILVLLYVAIQTILGLGHETKKMIVKVIIMALLINFSMFFTKVVIDTSNILALVFYNRLDVTAGRQYIPSTPNKEKDISGEMYKAFRATDLLTPEYLKKVQNETSGQTLLPLALKLGLIGISGTIMLFAAYAFFVSGFMFLGRLIELWVLIIFSPFAFMSSAIPKLAGVEYIGWEDWSKRLISTTFMAPIFMLFMYLIFLLLRANPFENFFDKNTGFVATILGVLIPSLLIIALLLKATKYAEKGGGAFGEIVMKGAKFAGGLAVTAAAAAASGGTALAARVVIGGAGGA